MLVYDILFCGFVCKMYFIYFACMYHVFILLGFMSLDCLESHTVLIAGSDCYNFNHVLAVLGVSHVR